MQRIHYQDEFHLQPVGNLKFVKTLLVWHYLQSAIVRIFGKLCKLVIQFIG